MNSIDIAYQGIPGSYSIQALDYYFNGILHSNVSKPDFESVFSSLFTGKCQYGIVPIENTLGGSIICNYDLLEKYSVKIVDEISFNIRHCLCCKESDDINSIDKIISHPQALQQCKNNIKNINCHTELYSNTATSAKYVADSSDNIACISSYKAAKLYNLKILNDNFADQPEKNITRFIVITSKTNNNAIKTNVKNTVEYTKTSIIIALKDGVGALSDILDCFRVHKCNLTKLESRPNLNKSNPFDYLFYIDFLRDINLSVIDSSNIDTILQNKVSYVKYLGNYEYCDKIHYMENHNTKVVEVLVEEEEEEEDSKLSIGIIGFGTFGQFLAHKFKQKHKVLTTSRTDYSEKCKSLGIEYYRDYDTFFSQKIDVLVISVSIIAFDKVLKGIVNYLKGKNILVVDVLSVKVYPKTIMLDYIPESCDIIAAHPMFGPKSSPSLNWTNNNLVYEPVRCNTKNRVSRFIKIFKQCNIYILSCEQHDKIVAETQFITHYIGRLLLLLDLQSYNINTNTYKMLLDIKTILNRDNNDLFIGMYQYNKYTKDIITKIKGKIQDIDTLLDNNYNIIY